jgi:hypothetical protein
MCLHSQTGSRNQPQEAYAIKDSFRKVRAQQLRDSYRAAAQAIEPADAIAPRLERLRSSLPQDALVDGGKAMRLPFSRWLGWRLGSPCNHCCKAGGALQQSGRCGLIARAAGQLMCWGGCWGCSVADFAVPAANRRGRRLPLPQRQRSQQLHHHHHHHHTLATPPPSPRPPRDGLKMALLNAERYAEKSVQRQVRALPPLPSPPLPSPLPSPLWGLRRGSSGLAGCGARGVNP